MVESGIALSVVIPVYGSARILPELARQLEAALAPRYGLDGFEAVLVHDCGPDDAWPVIESLAAQHPWLGGVDLRMNAGQHNAVMAGLAHARGAIVVTMDDDCSIRPPTVASLVAPIEAGADVTYAHFASREHATWKVLGSRFNDWVAQRLLKKPRGLYLSPFRAMRSEIRDEVLRYDGPFVYVDGLILQATRNIATVEVEHHARGDGRSGYSFASSCRCGRRWRRVSRRAAALRFAGRCAFVGRRVPDGGRGGRVKLLHPEWTSGWASMIVTVLILGGIQLLSLGAIGEYVGRVLLTLNGKPQYVVRKTIGRLTARE
jgi:undecaprenyl-phosphate 4-deoxy-4-formamido-L-arabinose transferase